MVLGGKKGLWGYSKGAQEPGYWSSLGWEAGLGVKAEGLWMGSQCLPSPPSSAETLTWNKPSLSGVAPLPRSLHSATTIGNK